jgi:hypothetical protein
MIFLELKTILVEYLPFVDAVRVAVVNSQQSYDMGWHRTC